MAEIPIIALRIGRHRGGAAEAGGLGSYVENTLEKHVKLFPRRKLAKRTKHAND